jgi:hypothetical protein
MQDRLLSDAREDFSARQWKMLMAAGKGCKTGAAAGKIREGEIK